MGNHWSEEHGLAVPGQDPCYAVVTGETNMASLPILRALTVLANPADLVRFDDEFLSRQFSECLGPFQQRGSLQWEALQHASLLSLRSRLAAAAWSVVHLVVHGKERMAANYGTIALENPDGRAGNITAQALAALLAAHSSLEVVILQSACSGPLCFSIVADELIGKGVPCVVTVPRLPERLQNLFLSRLYGGLLLGLSASQLAESVTAIHPLDPAGLELVRVLSGDPQRSILGLELPKKEVADPPRVQQAVVVNPPKLQLWQETLLRKRQEKAFDVFLCHNSADKPMVRQIGQQLKEAGILPWLDADELPPGHPWQPLLEQQIENIRSAAVCIGAAGIGPWQQQEMYGFLNAFVQRGVPVIPLLLPDAPSAPKLPIFLTGMTWVDFRARDCDPLKQLIWGITGDRPDI